MALPTAWHTKVGRLLLHYLLLYTRLKSQEVEHSSSCGITHGVPEVRTSIALSCHLFTESGSHYEKAYLVQKNVLIRIPGGLILSLLQQ